MRTGQQSSGRECALDIVGCAALHQFPIGTCAERSARIINWLPPALKHINLATLEGACSRKLLYNIQIYFCKGKTFQMKPLKAYFLMKPFLCSCLFHTFPGGVHACLSLRITYVSRVSKSEQRFHAKRLCAVHILERTLSAVAKGLSTRMCMRLYNLITEPVYLSTLIQCTL